MKRAKRDPVREDRIHNEAIVDAGPDEQALSWYYYVVRMAPLSQLAAIDPDESTREAIGDWHYWVSQGCVL